jgi:superfamily II DNA or RNA helicase
LCASAFAAEGLPRETLAQLKRVVKLTNSMQLRPYQEEAVDGILKYATANPTGRLLLVIPQGGGKTFVGATAVRLMAADHGLRALVAAHRREIINQTYDSLLESGIPGAFIGVVMAGDKRANPGAPIQLASVDTLNRRNKPVADLVLTDEAHRDASDSRRRLRALYPHAFRLGMTATPCRLDGRGLREDYDDMLVVSSPSQLIADGYLSAPLIYTVPDELLPCLKGVRTIAGDYDQGATEKASNKRALVGGIVDHWKRRAGGRRTVAFAVGTEHSRHIVSAFNAAGIPAAHLGGETGDVDRKRILASLNAGDLSVVSTCDVLSQGWDLPSCKCAILARPTKSLVLHRQQGGRVMRPWNGVEPIILDHAGNVMRPGLGAPHSDQEWSLDAPKTERRGEAPMKVCDCGAVIPAGQRVCNCCGTIFAEADRIPVEESGELQRFLPKFTDDERATVRALVQAIANERGCTAEWVDRVCAARFGESVGQAA